MDRKVLVACLILITVGVSGLFIGVAVQPEFASDRRVILLPFFSVCTAIIVSSLLIIIFDLYIRSEEKTKKNELVVKAITDSVQETILAGSIGFRGLHDGVPDSKIVNESSDAKFLDILNTYAPNLVSLRVAVERVFFNDGTVRLLVASADSPFVDLRLNRLHREKSEFIGNVETNISRLVQFWESTGRKGNLEIKRYDGSPGICYYATGSIAFVGTYLEGYDAINSPQLELDKRSWAYERYAQHFERVWNSSNSVELNHS
jgi:hypothetical protein